MASNQSSDPNNSLLPSQSSSPAYDAGGAGSDFSQTPSINSFATPATPSVGATVARVNNPNGLTNGTLLSNGRYQIDKLVASGGMGAVYRAIDTRFNRPCAVKEMLDNFRNERERAQSIEWFSREASLLLDLNHPCIPRVRDFFAENGRHYLVMDFIEGGTLADKMDKEADVQGINGAHGIPEARARDWAHQLCGVLAYLHRQNPPIIFRDLKPSNIMVANTNEIKLIDFGIARTFQTLQQSTVIMTMGYAPPEQMHGMPEPRSDLYALGATLHKLITRHDAANNKPNIFMFPPLRSLRPDITPAFDQLILKALAPSVEQRWSSAEEMDRALLNLPPITVVPTLVVPSQGRSQINLTPGLPNSGSGGQYGPPSGGSNPSATRGTSGPAGMHITAALSHLSATRIEPAYDAVKMAHGFEPNNPLVHKIFGQVYARRRPPQVDTAITAYNRSLQLNPDDAETHKLVGDVYLYLRPNPAQAAQAYEQSIRLNPQDFESHERLAECYDKTNRSEMAIREFQEAIRLVSNQPEVVRLRLFFALGQAAMRGRQWPVAEHAFVQVLMLNPSDNQARFFLSQIYEQEGKLEDAFRECGYVMGGPLANTNPAVSQLFYRLKNRLGR